MRRGHPSARPSRSPRPACAADWRNACTSLVLVRPQRSRTHKSFRTFPSGYSDIAQFERFGYKPSPQILSAPESANLVTRSVETAAGCSHSEQSPISGPFLDIRKGCPNNVEHLPNSSNINKTQQTTIKHHQQHQKCRPMRQDPEQRQICTKSSDNCPFTKSSSIIKYHQHTLQHHQTSSDKYHSIFARDLQNQHGLSETC